MVARGQRPLEPGEEAHEERVGLKLGRIARQHEPDARARASVRARACALGRQPSSSAARRIRARVASPTPGRSLTANETAAAETPARRATSVIVGRRRGVGEDMGGSIGVSSAEPELKRFSDGREMKMGAKRAVVRGDRAGGAGGRAGAGGGRAVGDPAAGGPPRGRGGDARAGARVPGRAVLRQRLAHDRRDGRHRHAAAEAARLGLVRGRRRVGRAGDEVHERLGLQRATSCPPTGGLRAAAHRRRARRLPRRAARAHADEPRPAQADGHRHGRRALRADDAVPVGLRPAPVPERERQRARHAARSTRGTLVFRDTGRLPGEDARPLLHGDRRLGPARRGRRDRARVTTGRSAPGRVCAADQTPAPMPRECDDGPFGRGTGGQLRYRVEVEAASGTETLWIAVAGSENSPGEARARVRAADPQPERLLAGKGASREALGALLARRPARRPAAAGVDRVGQAEPRRPHAGGRPTSTCAGPTRAGSGRPRARSRGCAGSAPASRTTRGCSPSTASTPRTRA